MTAQIATVFSAFEVAIGLIFAISAGAKVRNPGEFVRTVSEYRLLPNNLAAVAASTVMGLEVSLAVMLVLGVWSVIALPIALLILVGFLVAVGVNLRRGRRIRCGCFGTREPISSRTVARLLLLIVAATIATLSMLVVPGSSMGMLGATSIEAAVHRSIIATGLLLAGAWLLALPDLLRLARILARQTAK